MNARNVIFVPTIPHTGTWFVLRFLERFVPNIVEAKNTGGRITEPTILHTHFPVINYLDIHYKPNYPYIRTEKNPKSLTYDAIELMISLFKTVIPIRDPLAAILTREARHPELRHFFIVDGFIEASRYLGHPNVMFFPIDLYEDWKDRKKLLIKLARHCRFDVTQLWDYYEQMAKDWNPENDTPNNRFKILYESKDIGGIEFLLGPKTAEIEYLKNQAATILPFLAKLGYTKGDLDLW